MNTRVTIPCWLTALLLGWLAIWPAMAHDTGLLVLRFEELGDERYQLEYLARPGTPESEGIPILPQHCTWEEEPGVPAGMVRLIFASDGVPLSGEDRIILPWKKSGVLVHAFWRSGETARRFCKLEDEGIVVRIGELRAGTGGVGEAAKRYTLLGIDHIARGLDHLLFLAGLLMLVRGWKKIAVTITAFTAGHSLSLALSAFGRITVSQGLVDALVALSIVFLALEILHLRQGREGLTARKPWIVALLFGLIHGLGFAGALLGLGLPPQDLPLALLFFNLGIEAGQLLLILLWFSVLAAARALSLSIPRSLAWAPAYGLGIVATFWFFDRTLILFS